MMPMMPQPNPRQAMNQSALGTVDQMMAGKQPQQAVNYRPADDPAKTCAKCTNFLAPNQCKIVAGKIDPQATCDNWTGEMEGQQEDTAEGGVEE